MISWVKKQTYQKIVQQTITIQCMCGVLAPIVTIYGYYHIWITLNNSNNTLMKLVYIIGMDKKFRHLADGWSII